MINADNLLIDKKEIIIIFANKNTAKSNVISFSFAGAITKKNTETNKIFFENIGEFFKTIQEGKNKGYVPRAAHYHTNNLYRFYRQSLNILKDIQIELLFKKNDIRSDSLEEIALDLRIDFKEIKEKNIQFKIKKILMNNIGKLINKSSLKSTDVLDNILLNINSEIRETLLNVQLSTINKKNIMNKKAKI